MAKMIVCAAVCIAAMLLCSTTFGMDANVKVLGNDQIVKGFVGFGDPNGGVVGPLIGWNDQDAGTAIYSAGVRGEYDISEQAWSALDSTIGLPETWKTLFSQLQARPYILCEIGAANLRHDVEAVTSPGIGFRVGPFSFEGVYDIFESGVITHDGIVLDESGWDIRFSIGKTWTF